MKTRKLLYIHGLSSSGNSLAIKFWKNPELQLLEIEKEVLLPQIEDKLRFLADYKQALHEFFDIFDSNSFLEKRYSNIHIQSDASESLASMLFRKYSFWNNESDYNDVQLRDEYNAVDLYLSELVAVSTILPQMKGFFQLYQMYL